MKVDLSKYQNRHGAANKLKRLLWDVCWTCLARTTPKWCLNGWRCFLLKAFGAKIGKGCRVQGSARIWQPWKLTMGDYSWIDHDVDVYTVAPITIGSNCSISEHAFLCTAGHDPESATYALTTAPIVLEDGVDVLARATVLPGVTLHEGAFVAACSVVTHDVAPWTIVAGVPARALRTRQITRP